MACGSRPLSPSLRPRRVPTPGRRGVRYLTLGGVDCLPFDAKSPLCASHAALTNIVRNRDSPLETRFHLAWGAS